MPLIEGLRSQGRKRKRGTEAAPGAEPDSPPQLPTKRQKQPSPSRSRPPPAFWDKLSRVPLCRRALREFNRRAAQPIVPKPRLERDINGSLVKQLKRFSRRGGPDLRNIRGVSSDDAVKKHADFYSTQNRNRESG